MAKTYRLAGHRSFVSYDTDDGTRLAITYDLHERYQADVILHGFGLDTLATLPSARAAHEHATEGLRLLGYREAQDKQ